MSTSDSFSFGVDTLDRMNPGPAAVGVARRTSLLGARMAALIIDALVVVVPALTAAWILSLAFPRHGLFFSKSASTLSSSGSTHYQLGFPGFLVVSALSLGYFFLYEAVRGQTIGKRAMCLRVRSASGGRAGLNAISARTVLRLIDVLPFFYLVGTLVALLSGSRRRRIGDWAGGTVVVRDEGIPGEPNRRLSWRVAGYPALWLFGVLFATFALGLGKAAGEREQALSQSCSARGISTAEGREGTCARGGGAFGALTVYNVVDYNHTLRMPEYEAHLAGSMLRPTRVTNASENPDIYPGGLGQLVSYRVVITNTGTQPLALASGTAGETAPSYQRHPLVELELPAAPGSPLDLGYPAILHGRRAPAPSIFQPQPILPHERRVGWVTFVAPARSLSLLSERPADVDFARADGSSGYVGQIRLWK